MPSKSSRRWLDEHFSDQYVKRSQKEGYRSRAAYKLLELDAKDHLLKPGMTVVDLGAAPGGWSQVAAEKVGDKGRVVALDILPMDALLGVDFMQGDFREQLVLDELLALNVSPCDLVISDMAPNMSGIKVADQAGSMYLAELTLMFSQEHLKPGGNMTVKVFQGAGFDEFLRDMRASFSKVVVRKPGASRSRSREVYLVGFARR
jgi:23S rRNA (uridine2552-2'-O)-methyltransferase